MQGRRGDRREVRLEPREPRPTEDDGYGPPRRRGGDAGHRDDNDNRNGSRGQAKGGGRTSGYHEELSRSPRRDGGAARGGAAGGGGRRPGAATLAPRRDAPMPREQEEDVYSGSEEPPEQEPEEAGRRAAGGGRGQPAGGRRGQQAEAVEGRGGKPRRRSEECAEEAPRAPDRGSRHEAPRADTTAAASPPPVRKGPSLAPVAAEPPPRNAVPLSVSGCSNLTISAIVKGNYTPYSANHGKVVYRKDDKSKGFEVLIYYWDDRDGPEVCGWWFGPNVGGDQVWAYHPSRSSTSPPSSEWNVPHDGAIDPTFSVSARVDGSRGQAASQRPSREEQAPPARSRREEPVPEPTASQRPSREEHAPPRNRREEPVPERSNDREQQPRGREEPPMRRERGGREDRYAVEPPPSPPPSSRQEPGRDRPGREPVEQRPDPRARDAREAQRPETSREAPKHNHYEAPHERERREEKRSVDEPQADRRPTSTHQHFVDAYNKRRQAAQENTKVTEDDPKDRPRDDRRRGGEDRGDEDRRGAPMDRKGGEDRGDEDRRGAPMDRRRRDEEPPQRAQEPPQRAQQRDRSPMGRREVEPPPRAPQREVEPPPRAPQHRDRSPIGRAGRGDAGGDRRAEERDRSPIGRQGRGDAGGERRGEGRQDGRGDRGGPAPDARGGRHEQERRRDPRDDGDRRKVDDRRGDPRDDEARRKADDSRAEERRAEDERRQAKDKEDDKKREEDRRQRDEDRKKDDEKRRQEDEVSKEERERQRKQKEDEMRKKDEELQKRRDEKREAEALKQKEVDEQRRKEGAEKRKEDQERLEQERKERRSEEDKQAAEALARREEEQKALRQQQATLNVLQVLQKLSSATPDNFDALKKDLDDTLLTELPECGQQQDILKAEADRVLDYARHYVKQVTDQREAEESKRLALEKTSKDLLEELEKLVGGAEEASEGVYYTAAPLSGENELPDMEVVKISRDVQRLGRAAMAACSTCADFITHKRPIIEEAESIGEESAAVIAVLLPRIRAATRRTAEAFQQGKEHREKVEKRVLASRYVARKNTIFSKYDKDGDGYMSLEDISSYAKAEFNFDVPEAILDRIKKKLFQGDGTIGIAREDFQLLKAAVGIARAEELGRHKRKERVEKEATDKEEAEKRKIHIEQRKSQLQDTLREMAKDLTKLEPAIKSAEAIAEALAGEAGQLGSEELKKKSDTVDAETKDTREKLENFRSTIKDIIVEVGEVPELQDFMRGILVPLSSRSDIFDMRLKKALETAASGRQLAQYMALSEYEGLWTEVVVKLRACIESVEGKSVDDLFDVIAGSDITVPDGTPGAECDTVTTSEIQTFLTTHSCEVEHAKLDKLFGRSATQSAGAAEDIEDADAGVQHLIEQGEKQVAESKPHDAMEVDAKEGSKKEDKIEDAAKDKEEEAKDAPKEESPKAGDNEPAKEEAKKDEEPSKPAKYDRAELLKKTMVELKAECARRGLDQKGRAKADLVDRLMAAPEEKKEDDASKKEETKEAKKDEGNKDEAKKDEAKKDEAKEATTTEEAKKDDAKEEEAPKAEEGGDKKDNAEGTVDILAEAAKAAAKFVEIAKEKAADNLAKKAGLHIARVDFKRIIRMYYKVVRHCVLSDNLQIEQSSQIRRMDVGEVIEVHRGPTLDTSVNVYRVFGRCIRDGINGWGTIAGNTGVTFLMPGGRIFTVKIAVALTEDLKDTEGEKLVRMVDEGEVLEVLEWARTSRSALGVTRIRARAQLDNAVGWATTIGNDEKVYLEAM